MMVTNTDRRIAAEKLNSYLCPEMEKQLDKLLEVGRHWHISRSSEFVSEVHSYDLVMVDLENGIIHVVNGRLKVSLAHMQLQLSCTTSNAYDYIKDYFTSDYYKSSYSFPIEPIPNIHQPPLDIVKDFSIKPPVTRKQPSRPRVKRIKSNEEEPTSMNYERCK
ncbi:uncharacterized protein [Malus domestica]|uniref:uncharacterized protein n=1 Tax=Malus domestica TaxID=3750 RepID=UPI0039761C84